MRERETCTQCGTTYEVATGTSQTREGITCKTCGAALAPYPDQHAGDQAAAERGA